MGGTTAPKGPGARVVRAKGAQRRWSSPDAYVAPGEYVCVPIHLTALLVSTESGDCGARRSQGTGRHPGLGRRGVWGRTGPRADVIMNWPQEAPGVEATQVQGPESGGQVHER